MHPRCARCQTPPAPPPHRPPRAPVSEMLQWKVQGWGAGAWPQKGCSEVGASVLEARSVLGGCEGALNEPLPTMGRIWGEGTCQDPSAQPPAPRLLPAPSPPPRRLQSGWGQAARGWRLLPRAGSCLTEPGLSPGAARGPPCPTAAEFCLAGLRKSPASACSERSGTVGFRSTTPLPRGFRGSPRGEQPPGGRVTGGSSSSGPWGRHRLRLRREMGFGISGVPGASPSGASLSLSPTAPSRRAS